MSSEQETAESRLLTGSTPSTEPAEESTAASMGDVLTKEHKDDDEPSPASEEQPEPPPPLPAIEELSIESQTPGAACQIDVAPEPLEVQMVKVEDRLSGEVVLNGDHTSENGEATATTEVKVQCRAASTTTDDLCNCEDCKWKKRDLSAEDLQEMIKLRRLGMDLRQYIRYTFNWFMESSGFTVNTVNPSAESPLEMSKSAAEFLKLQNSVVLLCERVPYHLFMWLVGQAQEFVIGVKVQLLTLLYDRSIDNLAEVFLTKLLDGYEALLATAVHISDLLEPLQKELFSKVNLTWSYINKSLYQNYVYSDPLIQNNLPPFIGQLRKYLPIKGSEYHYLVHRYLAFDDEITKIGTLCPEIERLIDKYNAEQVTGSVTGLLMDKLREDFEQKLKLGQTISDFDLSSKIALAKEIDDSSKIVQTEEIIERNSELQMCSLPNAVEIQSMFSDWKKSPQQRLAELVEALTLSSLEEEEEKSKTSIEKKCYSSCLNKTEKEGINKSVSCERLACKCRSNNFTTDSTLNLNQETTQNSQNNAVNHCVLESDNLKVDSSDGCKEPMKKVPKTTTAQTAQTQTRHSTTQTTNATHPHHQSQLHRHHHAGRLSPGENGDCSDSGSSHEDSCSATNSPTPRDSSRHCDCCYCEVFGHGVPSVAPVSRNYNEMRERLRQILSKKKAKVCKAACNPHVKNSVEVSSSSSSLSSSSSTSSTITNVDSTILPNPVSRSNTPISKISNPAPVVAAKVVNVPTTSAPTVSPVKPKEDQWNIEAAVEFIEGNQSGKKDARRAEKKARQKQKKLEEKQKKEKEEEEKQKLIELQKKKPEVTITVVDPQKQNSSQKSISQQKLPEVSILPTSAPSSSSSSMKQQANTSKKKNGETSSNNAKNANKVKNNSSTLATSAALENTKKKTASIVNDINLNRTKSKVSEKTNEPASQKADNEIHADLSNLSKKERRKLKREMENQVALKKETESKQSTTTVSTSSDNNQLQIVTIKRVMESTTAEPTVTITLKGQTPAEDRVLFTLINGLTKDSDEEKQSQSTGKKKKIKNNNSVNQQQQGQSSHNNNSSNNKLQQSQNNSASNIKYESTQKQDSKNVKQQQQPNKDKSKNAKQQDEQKARHQLNTSTAETKSTKSKKDKNSDNKENIKQVTYENTIKQGTGAISKKINKTAAVPPTTQKQQQRQHQQYQSQQYHQQNYQQQQQYQPQYQQQQYQSQYQQQYQPQYQQQQYQQPQYQYQQQSNSNNKNSKINKNQNQNQNQNQKKNNINQANSNKTGKISPYVNNVNQNTMLNKVDNQKVSKIIQNNSNKPWQNVETVQNQKKEQHDSSFNNYYRETANNASSSINIENLKLPPGITITKVNAPVKPLPLKSNTTPKPVNNTPKQTTIIAAPMSGVQPTNYGPPQGTGNLIVVDTGKLKQDLIPKTPDKDSSKDGNGLSPSSKKKKKKKNKNVSSGNIGMDKSNGNSNNIASSQNNWELPKLPQQNNNMEPQSEAARIVHNPATNMVTIRNPAFGPPPPRLEPTNTQQAAIIRVADNGMVTIRSPALQQAINAGLQPEPLSGPAMASASIEALRHTVKGTPIVQRTHQDLMNEADRLTTIINNGLSSLQISQVANGDVEDFPENGINLIGTSVTLTKVRNPEQTNQSQSMEQSEQILDEAIGSEKGCAKRSSRQSSSEDPESVFQPKEIKSEDDADGIDREVEAFKLFCLQCVPKKKRQKVNLNMKDLVLKKKPLKNESIPRD